MATKPGTRKRWAMKRIAYDALVLPRTADGVTRLARDVLLEDGWEPFAVEGTSMYFKRSGATA